MTITFRGEEKKQRVVKSVKMLGLDNPEILRRSANHYYGRYQGEFKAHDLLRKRLDVLPESGR